MTRAHTCSLRDDSGHLESGVGGVDSATCRRICRLGSSYRGGRAAVYSHSRAAGTHSDRTSISSPLPTPVTLAYKHGVSHD
ncbi:hypothetical protein J6590_097952 [Homalodisca vitripennis]|nr:hypothetical protein J6590_009804 [Homalodisca vitripennis]KAG8334073.1 hypothetical protein J6590_097952 [Homalodisca vitripennis]